jgi:hypothetical protein
MRKALSRTDYVRLVAVENPVAPDLPALDSPVADYQRKILLCTKKVIT